MIKRGGRMRLLHAIYVKHNMLPHEYGALSATERAFVRQSVLAQIEEENRGRK